MTIPVYLINLDASVERLEKSRQRLAQQNVSFEKISAVLGAGLTDEEIAEHYDAELNHRVYHTPLTPGQIGCYFSHRKAWKKIAEGDAEFGIILEDDFQLVGDLKLAISTIDSLSCSWDLIKLAAYQSRERPIKHRHSVGNGFDLVIHAKPMSGGAATALTKQAAIKLLAATNKFGRPSDTDIQHFWEKNIEVLSLMPYPVAQDMDFESTISAKKVKRKKYFWKRKYQQICTGIKNYIKVKQQVRAFKGKVNG